MKRRIVSVTCLLMLLLMITGCRVAVIVVPSEDLSFNLVFNPLQDAATIDGTLFNPIISGFGSEVTPTPIIAGFSSATSTATAITGGFNP